MKSLEKLMVGFFVVAALVLFVWVQFEQHKGADSHDSQKMEMATRARAIQSGSYDFSMDSYLGK